MLQKNVFKAHGSHKPLSFAWSFSVASTEYECGTLATSDEEILVWNYYFKLLSILGFILHFVGMMSHVRHDSITQGVSQRLVFLCPLYVTSYVVHPPPIIDLICCLCCFPFPAYGTGRARVLSLCVAASPLSSM